MSHAWNNLQTIEADGSAAIVTIRLNRPQVSNAINPAGSGHARKISSTWRRNFRARVKRI